MGLGSLKVEAYLRGPQPRRVSAPGQALSPTHWGFQRQTLGHGAAPSPLGSICPELSGAHGPPSGLGHPVLSQGQVLEFRGGGDPFWGWWGPLSAWLTRPAVWPRLVDTAGTVRTVLGVPLPNVGLMVDVLARMAGRAAWEAGPQGPALVFDRPRLPWGLKQGLGWCWPLRKPKRED